jgi:hypothetical protein
MSSFVPGTVGENKPIIKCNAKSGRFTVDDVSVIKIQFIADVENAEAGWMRFGENVAPDFKLVRVKDLLAGKPYPTAPDARDKDGKLLYRKGFRMWVKISDKLTGDKPNIRELASNSFAVTTAIDGLMRAWYEQHRQDGKLPLVSVTEWDEIPGQKGSNFRPQFNILKLVNRPVDLDDKLNGQAAKAADEVPAHVTDVAGVPEDFGDFDEDEAA